MKKYKWTVEIEIDETWVEDGFDLTDERAHTIMHTHLGYARSDEIAVRVTKRPNMFEVNKAQGAAYQEQRDGWPRSNAHTQRALYTVTRTDDDPRITTHGRARIYGVPQNADLDGSSRSERFIGIEPDEYTIEVGDTIFEIEGVARCIGFAPSVKYYDARARSKS